MTEQNKPNRTQIRDLSVAEQEINQQAMKKVKGGKEPQDNGVVISSPCPTAKCERERGHSGPHGPLKGAI